MLARLRTFTLLRMDALPVEVEVDLSPAALPIAILTGTVIAVFGVSGRNFRGLRYLARIQRVSLAALQLRCCRLPSSPKRCLTPFWLVVSFVVSRVPAEDRFF